MGLTCLINFVLALFIVLLTMGSMLMNQQCTYIDMFETKVMYLIGCQKLNEQMLAREQENSSFAEVFPLGAVTLQNRTTTGMRHEECSFLDAGDQSQDLFCSRQALLLSPCFVILLLFLLLLLL